MTLSRIFFFSCLSFIAGIGAASFWQFGQMHILAVFICGIFLISAFWPASPFASVGPRRDGSLGGTRSPMATAGVLLAAVAFGLWLSEAAESKEVQNELRNFYEEEVVFEAKVVGEPQAEPHGMRFAVRPDFISDGKVLIRLESGRGIQYGDVLEVKGKLQTPRAFDDFDYAAFLAKDGIYAVMSQPQVKVLQRGAYEGMGEEALALVFAAKGRFTEQLKAHVAPPGSEIAGAILLGEKASLLPETREKLNAAGVRHITAISGMHVSILTVQLMSFLLWIGLWRWQAFYATLALMVLFVVLTGLQPSAVRAGIMGGMFLLGQHMGRQNVSSRALVFAAAGMLVANPFLLARDVGFQLSFLAVLGIILFLPIFQHLSAKIPAKLANLRDIVGMTIAAHIFTLPILIFNFGYVSLVTIATNVLIIPLLSGFMGFGFLFLFSGALVSQLGFLFSLPVSLFLVFMNGVIDFFSSLPFASAKTENLSFFWLVFLYIPVALFYRKFRKQHTGFIQF